jgi:hypothetical protein
MLYLLQITCVGIAATALVFGQSSAHAQFAAAYQELLTKDYDSAIASFRSGLQQQPSNSQARKDLAYTLIKTGESAAARDEFRMVLDLNKSDEQAALEYGFLADETGEPDEARLVFGMLCKSGSAAARKIAREALITIEKQGTVGGPRLSPPTDEGNIASTPSIRNAHLWAFFDSAYRMHADVDYLARRLSHDGISLLFVAAWHNMQPDAAADDYLNRLISACHQHGIVVYAWLELPYVSERFWTDHPNWREKDGLNQDAQIGWRKLMNLQNPDCNRSAELLVSGLLQRFDWDGVNLAELSFEGGGDPLVPAGFTPLDENVRSEFKELTDFDPLQLFDPASSHDSGKDRAAFLKFRAVVESRLKSNWLRILENAQREKPYLDTVLTVRDEQRGLILETAAQQKIGVDLSVIGLSRTQLSEAIQSASKQGLSVALALENEIGRTDLRAAATAVSSAAAELPGMIDVLSAEVHSATASQAELDIAYQSRSRAAVAFDKTVSAIEVDGAPFWKASGTPCSGWALLPAGQHVAAFICR